jgi:hypothetical protein
MMQRLIDLLQQPADADLFVRFVRRQTQLRTHIHEEHPCIADRLGALGRRELLNAASPPPVFPAPEASALALLGRAREYHLSRANTIWKNGWIPGWRNHHAFIHATLKQLDSAGQAARDSEPEGWPRLRMLASYLPLEQSQELLCEFLRRNPDYAPASQALGELLLENEDEGGIEWIEKAMSADSEYRIPGLLKLLEYFRAVADDARADGVIARLEQEQKILGVARRERKHVRRGDEFTPHGLSGEAIEKVRRRLRFHPRIRTAWLVRKKVRLHADKPAYVLGLICRPFQPDADQWLARYVPGLLEITCTVVVLGLSSRRLRARLEKIAGSLILSDSESGLGPLR